MPQVNPNLDYEPLRPRSAVLTSSLAFLGIPTAVLLVVALFPLPFGFYVGLRWLVTAATASLVVPLWNRGWRKVLLIAVALIIVYNPFVPIELPKWAWSIINVLSLIGFATLFCLAGDDPESPTYSETERLRIRREEPTLNEAPHALTPRQLCRAMVSLWLTQDDLLADLPRESRLAICSAVADRFQSAAIDTGAWREAMSEEVSRFASGDLDDSEFEDEWDEDDLADPGLKVSHAFALARSLLNYGKRFGQVPEKSKTMLAAVVADQFSGKGKASIEEVKTALHRAIDAEPHRWLSDADTQ